MRKVYYIPGRKLTFLLLILAFFLLANKEAVAQQPTSLKSSALESHEGMTITAQPWTDPALYKQKFHKKSPYAAGILALQVAFRNDSDDSVKVNLERIRLNITLSEEQRQALNPLTSEEAADVILNPSAKSLSNRRLPIGGPKFGHDKKWLDVERELREAGVHASIVAPRATVQGLLYFDMRSQFDLLSTARLYVPELVAIEKNHELMYFDIDLSRATER